jgi:hypothetical protein
MVGATIIGPDDLAQSLWLPHMSARSIERTYSSAFRQLQQYVSCNNVVLAPPHYFDDFGVVI